MKKLVLFMMLVIAFTSCKKDEVKEKVSSTAKIKVIKNGKPESGVTVYMFDGGTRPGTTFFTPFHSRKKVVTESNGVATFELRDVFELDPTNTQTTFYFAIFTNNDAILGKTAMTIKKGETKNAEISY